MPSAPTDRLARPPLEDMLCFALYKAHHAMNRVYKPLLGELGLTYPQYLVLLALWERDDQNVGQLGALLHLESNTLTPLLKRLEAAGLVHRRRAANDERQVMVSLTEAGRAMREKSQGVAQCISDALGMAREDVRPLVSGVTAVADTLVADREG
ncbi:MarR family winged helix-turn-helix transcriptional regulator [Nisaea sediminum]|uniref:MarR family winged helix-turn-helix transcriptional regulator n=1 Tax=Nisaea sediminum TaxID=2775867 RepID=UPI0018676BD3|nr:MarR family transcriptional regulator [Nisaea sediminum]